MDMLSTRQIRSLFLSYFKQHGHQIVKSSSLVPANDPTLLFVNAGMVQFKDVFLGAEKRDYQRAVSSQRCVRAGGKHNDLDQVGYTARHHTFFEMLGNFSFGDYFKTKAIELSWDFLTNELNLPEDKLLVTVFEEDDEAEQIWHEVIGLPMERILRIGAKDNFWQMGDTGPCGPCSEIFYDHGPKVPGGPPGSADEDGDRFIEIWNLVFMQFDRQADGELVPLPKPSVDTGMGLERIAAILQGKHSNYEIDLFQGLIKAAAQLTGCDDLSQPSLKVIADHIRTCAFLIADGVLPSNEGRGYVLRRIIRRAARHGHKLGAENLFFYQMVEPLIQQMGEDYPELIENRSLIEKRLKKEELQFAETLDTGMQEFNKVTAGLASGEVVSGDLAFKLYDTFGFPLDLTEDLAREHNRSVDVVGFNRCMEAQKQRSRSNKQFNQQHQIPADLIQTLTPTRFSGYDRFEDSGEIMLMTNQAGQQCDFLSAGEQGWVVLNRTPFYAESGGQVGDTGWLVTDTGKARVHDTQKAAGQYHIHAIEITAGGLKQGLIVEAQVDKAHRQKVILNHSATHLLHKVLRAELGEHVQQKGSLVNAEKLRFDFSHDLALNPKQLRTIERLVNRAIRDNLPAQEQHMAYDEAIEYGAVALFGEKYGDHVRVMDFGGYSVELCGGTHVQATGDIGLFKIISEGAVASGIRRIEAITGETALKWIEQQQQTIQAVSRLIKSKPENIVDQVKKLVHHNKDLQHTIQQIQQQQTGNIVSDVFNNTQTMGDINLLSHVFESADAAALRDGIDGFKSKYTRGVVIFGLYEDEKVQLMVGVTKDLIKEYRAGDLVKTILSEIGGRGGGRPDFAQGGGQADLNTFKTAIEKVVSQQFGGKHYKMT
ncbi:MAG: alanine--tRNA ligase [Marinicella pacifica]